VPRLRTAGLAAALSAAVAWAGELRLVVEHIPPLVYVPERVPVCVRVENRSAAEVSCQVEATLFQEDGKGEPLATRSVTVLPSGSAPAAFELPSSGWVRARIALCGRDSPQDFAEILRFDAGGDLPPLEAVGDRLRAVSGAGARRGELAVICLPRRTLQPDREWYLWKRLAERLEEGSLPAGVLLLAPAFGARGGERRREAPGGSSDAYPALPVPGPAEGPEEPAYFPVVREKAGTRVEAVALPGESAEGVLHPVLADLAAALDAMRELRRRVELVIWVVACDDARRATPVRLFRKAADLILMRARAAGASRLSILFLPEPAVERSRRELYAEELAQAASAYRAGFVRLDALAGNDFWLAAAGTGKALGRYPNARGRTALAEAILARIRP